MSQSGETLNLMVERTLKMFEAAQKTAQVVSLHVEEVLDEAGHRQWGISSTIREELEGPQLSVIEGGKADEAEPSGDT